MKKSLKPVSLDVCHHHYPIEYGPGSFRRRW